MESHITEEVEKPPVEGATGAADETKHDATGGTGESTGGTKPVTRTQEELDEIRRQ